jgi:hypothetical protein
MFNHYKYFSGIQYENLNFLVVQSTYQFHIFDFKSPLLKRMHYFQKNSYANVFINVNLK